MRRRWANWNGKRKNRVELEDGRVRRRRTDQLLLLQELFHDRHLTVLVRQLRLLHEHGLHLLRPGLLLVLHHDHLLQVLIHSITSLRAHVSAVGSGATSGHADEGGDVGLDLEGVLTLTETKLLKSVLQDDLVHCRETSLKYEKHQ